METFGENLDLSGERGEGAWVVRWVGHNPDKA